MTKQNRPPQPQNNIDPKDLEIQALKDKLARALADYHNLETRMARENANFVKYANSDLLTKLLEIRDHLGMAAASGDKSLSIILSTFDKLLEGEGVASIRQDGEFDPTLMECAEEVQGDKNQIVQTLRIGYILQGRVLRTARVTVGNGQVN